MNTSPKPHPDHGLRHGLDGARVIYRHCNEVPRIPPSRCVPRRWSTHRDPPRSVWPRPRRRGRVSTPTCRQPDDSGRSGSSRGRRAGSHPTLCWHIPGEPATLPMRPAPECADAYSRCSQSCGQGRVLASGLTVGTGSFVHQPRLLVRQRHVPSCIAFSTSARTCSRVSAASRAGSVVLAPCGALCAIWCWAAAKIGEPTMTAAAANVRVIVKMQHLRMVNPVSLLMNARFHSMARVLTR